LSRASFSFVDQLASALLKGLYSYGGFVKQGITSLREVFVKQIRKQIGKAVK